MDSYFDQNKQSANITRRRLFLLWLKSHVPSAWWEHIWWLAPLATLAIIPLGQPTLYLLGLLGWAGAGRAMQGLILLAVTGGLVVGATVLWSIREANLEPRLYNRALWLARLSVIGPLLTVLILVLIFHRDCCG